MVHIKWAIALVLTAVLSVVITQWATEQFVIERTRGQLAEIAIMRNTTLSNMIKELNEGKTEQVKSKLLAMFELEAKDVREARTFMQKGYFARSNEEYIQRIDRYLAPPAAAASGAK
ncbi:MAG: hypothetical protein V4858_21875 [Pseudomonadota bacterium]